MDLLAFARGPALTFAMAIFVIGVLWRLVGVLPLPPWRDYSPARARRSPRTGSPRSRRSSAR